MSWLARSLANSLRLDDDGDHENDIVPVVSPRKQPHHENTSGSDEEAQGRGVKEDLDEIKQTLTRQFWGVASFLAPPSNSHLSDPSTPTFISNHSDQQASISLQPRDSGSEGILEPAMDYWDVERAVGITEEVLAFAVNIAMHPETWLDFPIEEEDDTHDFDMSDAQQHHAAAIERLTPRLAALRIELCPFHMSESYFWKVYFVLLHSRLNKQDAAILSTPQVMSARAIWMKELQKQTKPELESFGRSTYYSRDTAQNDDFAPSFSDDDYSDDMPHPTYGYETRIADHDTEEHTVESSETHFIHKSVEETLIIKTDNKDLKCGRSSQIVIQDYDDDNDDDEWPEEDSDLGEYGGITLPLVNEEDISFSDLEDDDYDIKAVSSNKGSKLV